jgi:hypothetical protein
LGQSFAQTACQQGSAAGPAPEPQRQQTPDAKTTGSSHTHAAAMQPELNWVRAVHRQHANRPQQQPQLLSHRVSRLLQATHAAAVQPEVRWVKPASPAGRVADSTPKGTAAHAAPEPQRQQTPADTHNVCMSSSGHAARVELLAEHRQHANRAQQQPQLQSYCVSRLLQSHACSGKSKPLSEKF